MIYSVDSVIHLSNNRGQEYKWGTDWNGNLSVNASYVAQSPIFLNLEYSFPAFGMLFHHSLQALHYAWEDRKSITYLSSINLDLKLLQYQDSKSVLLRF